MKKHRGSQRAETKHKASHKGYKHVVGPRRIVPASKPIKKTLVQTQGEAA